MNLDGEDQYYDRIEKNNRKLHKQNQIMREALEKIVNHDTLDGEKYPSYSHAYTGLVEFADGIIKKVKGVK